MREDIAGRIGVENVIGGSLRGSSVENVKVNEVYEQVGGDEEGEGGSMEEAKVFYVRGSTARKQRVEEVCYAEPSRLLQSQPTRSTSDGKGTEPREDGR